MTDQILSKEYIDPFMGGYQKEDKAKQTATFHGCL